MKTYKQLLWRNKGKLLGVGLLNVLTSLTMVAAGYSLSFLITAYEYDGNKVRALTITFGIVLTIWLAAMGIYYLGWLAKAKFQQRMKNDLRAWVSEQIAAMDHQAFVEKDCGNYVSWLTNDVDQIYAQSFSSLFSAIESFASTVFSLGALLLLGWQIGVAAVVLLVVISVLPQLTNAALQKANGQRSQALEISTERYKDVIMGSPVFFLSNLRERIVERISGASEDAEQVCWRYNRTNATVQSFVGTVSMVGQVVLVFVSLLVVVAGSTSAGAALSVGNLSGSFFNGAGDFVQAIMTVRASKPLWEKFQKTAPERTVEKTSLGPISDIRLEDVSFRYDDRPVLQNQSYIFQTGGKYAVMGESGSGKTTLTKLILGLLPGYTGRVAYGASEQREIELESLYDQVAYVDQQVYLFQDTVRFNITLGRSFTDEEVMNVIRICRLEEFVKALPDGLDTVILENGKDLSGGQRQRIALARSLIRKVRYLILDEGTSALDEKNAREIEDALLAQRDLCVILVTHHLREEARNRLTAVYQLSAL